MEVFAVTTPSVLTSGVEEVKSRRQDELPDLMLIIRDSGDDDDNDSGGDDDDDDNDGDDDDDNDGDDDDDDDGDGDDDDDDDYLCSPA